jgi:hypothetical protein
MYDIPLRYLASVFVDAESVTTSAENVTGLLKALNDKTLLPVSVQEQSLTGSVPRIGLTTPDGEWQLALLGKRFDVTYFPNVQDKFDLVNFSNFCRIASAKLITALNFFQRKAHRLAAVQEGFLPEFSKEEMNGIADRLFKFPVFYSKNLPFEWDWRAAAVVERTFGGLKEPTNTIVTIKRWAGTMAKKEDGGIAQAPIDRIRADFDINTLPANIIGRFEEAHISSFFEEAGAWHENFSAEIFSFILTR